MTFIVPLNAGTDRPVPFIDLVPQFQSQSAEVMAAVEVEPLARSIAMAPAEDEEITDEMATALDHARSSIASGEGIPHSEILREFGLNP